MTLPTETRDAIDRAFAMVAHRLHGEGKMIESKKALELGRATLRMADTLYGIASR